jgi:hypothetical protein
MCLDFYGRGSFGEKNKINPLSPVGLVGFGHWAPISV